MATIVNNPPVAQDTGSGGYGFLLGVILLIVFAVLFFIYGLPMITNMTATPQVNIPDKVDVNVNNSK